MVSQSHLLQSQLEEVESQLRSKPSWLNLTAQQRQEKRRYEEQQEVVRQLQAELATVEKRLRDLRGHVYFGLSGLLMQHPDHTEYHSMIDLGKRFDDGQNRLAEIMDRATEFRAALERVRASLREAPKGALTADRTLRESMELARTGAAEIDQSIIRYRQIVNLYHDELPQSHRLRYILFPTLDLRGYAQTLKVLRQQPLDSYAVTLKRIFADCDNWISHTLPETLECLKQAHHFYHQELKNYVWKQADAISEQL